MAGWRGFRIDLGDASFFVDLELVALNPITLELQDLGVE